MQIDIVGRGFTLTAAICDHVDRRIFTPSTNAPGGQHDANITFDQVAEMIGFELAEAVRDTSLAVTSAKYREVLARLTTSGTAR